MFLQCRDICGDYAFGVLVLSAPVTFAICGGAVRVRSECFRDTTSATSVVLEQTKSNLIASIVK